EVLERSLKDWKTFCEKTIKEPKIDPTYRRKPKKSADENKAEAQLRMYNVELKKKRKEVKMAMLPDRYAELTPLMAEEMRKLQLTKQQQDDFTTITRTLDDDHNLAWSGDLYAGFNKIFIGSEQGKIIRREVPTKPDEQLIIKRML
ncbi:hypothetical protein GCK32_019654, partial [Trichostrongylus colubriformis]